MIVSVLLSTFFISTFLLFYYYLNPIQLLLLLYLVRVLDHQTKNQNHKQLVTSQLSKKKTAFLSLASGSIVSWSALLSYIRVSLNWVHFTSRKKEKKRNWPLAAICLSATSKVSLSRLPKLSAKLDISSYNLGNTLHYLSSQI